MSTQTLHVQAPTRDEAALLAHFAYPTSPTVALCGKRLIGVDAPPNHPLCMVCKELYRERWGDPI